MRTTFKPEANEAGTESKLGNDSYVKSNSKVKPASFIISTGAKQDKLKHLSHKRCNKAPTDLCMWSVFYMLSDVGSERIGFQDIAQCDRALEDQGYNARHSLLWLVGLVTD